MHVAVPPKSSPFVEVNDSHLYQLVWNAKQSVWRLCAPSSSCRWSRPAGEDPRMLAGFPPPHPSPPSSIPLSSPVNHPWQQSKAAQLMGKLFPSAHHLAILLTHQMDIVFPWKSW